MSTTEGMLFGLTFGCVGFILTAIAVFILIRTRSFINKSRQTQGTITEMVYSSDSDGGGYIPVFRFRTLEGQEIEARGDLGTNPPQFKVGQTVEVLYDPENPGKARIKKWYNLYFVPTLLGFLGVVFSCIGVGAVIAMSLGLFN
jgi:hypothetical protein